MRVEGSFLFTSDPLRFMCNALELFSKIISKKTIVKSLIFFEMDRIQNLVGLNIIPNFTTLQKFLARIKSRYLGFIFAKTQKLFYSHDDEISTTAIDSSGFKSAYASHYYSERTGKIRKHFIKTSIAVDTKRQVIVGFVSSKSRVHDTRHARLLLS
jgi:hypothetical protein